MAAIEPGWVRVPLTSRCAALPCRVVAAVSLCASLATVCEGGCWGGKESTVAVSRASLCAGLGGGCLGWYPRAAEGLLVPFLLPPPNGAAVRPAAEAGAVPRGCWGRAPRDAGSGSARGSPPRQAERPAGRLRAAGGEGREEGDNLLWKCGMLNFPLLDTRPWGPGEVTSPQSCPLASAQRCPRRLAAGRRATSLQLPSAGFPIHRHWINPYSRIDFFFLYSFVCAAAFFSLATKFSSPASRPSQFYHPLK